MLTIMKSMVLGYIYLFIFMRTKLVLAVNHFNK
jgi:hypothetical protein